MLNKGGGVFAITFVLWAALKQTPMPVKIDYFIQRVRLETNVEFQQVRPLKVYLLNWQMS